MAVAAVTGGGGRLGCALVRALLAAGQRVRVLDVGDPASLAGLDVELIHGSVLDASAVREAIGEAAVVYHLAAKIDLDRDRDGSVFRVNVEGTREVAAACRDLGRRMVHCSSHHALVLEPLDQPLDESKPLALAHRCFYHRSKAQAEQLVSDMVREEGLDAVIVNPGTLVGPLDFAPSLLGQGLIDLYHGRLPALLNITSDCADVRDVAAAMIRAAVDGRLGERYLLTGDPVPMREMARLWSEISGCRVPRLFLPLWFGWFIIPFTIGAARLAGRKPLFTPNMLRASVSNETISIAKAAAELDYRVRPVRESLADAFAFYRAQGWL